jgi:hypothetical protein
MDVDINATNIIEFIEHTNYIDTHNQSNPPCKLHVLLLYVLNNCLKPNHKKIID